jgi:FkbM family methyltransferase
MNFYGQNKLDKLLYERYFINKERGFFVECGAADGVSENNCLFFEQYKKWKGINIEPTKRLYNELIINRPYCRNLNYALSNKEGLFNFTDCIKENSDIVYGLGSLTYYKENLNKLNEFEYIDFIVECKKFSSIYKKNKIIDLFILDVEGHELEALEGILEINKKFYPKIFCIEVNKIDVDKLNTTLEPFYLIDYKTDNDIIYKRRY